MAEEHSEKAREVIWGFANGVDLSPVLAAPAPNKGYGNSTTLAREEADRVLLALAETVAARLREDHVQVKVVSVGIRYYDLSYVSHQKVLGSSTDLTVEIGRAARELFGELWDHRPVRLLGVNTSRVLRDDFTRQMSLFDEVDYGKLAVMDWEQPPGIEQFMITD